jgi:hypothetical protein
MIKEAIKTLILAGSIGITIGITIEKRRYY